MTWLTPMLGSIAAAITVPTLIILYFLKLRRRDMEISTTLLWKKSIQDLQANAPFQKLRRNILLLLQLLILAAALFGIAQPRMKAESPVGSRHVIMIDRSASMSAKDEKNEKGDQVSRLDKAKEEAVKLVDSLREPGLFDKTSGDQAMLIVFDNTAKAVQTFTSDKDILKNAINAITPSDGPTLVDEAFRLARAQAPRRFKVEKNPDGTENTSELPSGPVGTIHLFSDGRLPDADKAQASREDVVIYHALGKADSPNIGITSLRAQRAIDNSSRLSVFVGLQNTAVQAKKVDVEIQVDGQVAGIKSVDLPAAASDNPVGTVVPAGTAVKLSPGLGGAVLTLDRPQGGIVAVHANVGAEDSLSVDDTAWIVVPPAKNLAVAIVTRGNLFLVTALEGLPGGKAPVIYTPEQYEVARAGNKLAEFDVIVLHDYLPTMPKDSTSPLPPGRYLVMGAVPTGPYGLIDKGKSDPTQFVDWARDHPALRGVSLDAPTIVKSHAIDIPKSAAARVLAFDGNGASIVELSAPESKSIVVPFDFMDSDWAIQLSFVLFLAQSVQYLGDDGSGLGQMVQPGGVLTDRIPLDAKTVKVRLPNAEQAEMGLPSSDGTIVFGPIQRSGVYQVSWEGPQGPTDAKVGDRSIRPFAANLLDSAESDIAAATTVSLANTKVTADPNAPSQTTRQLWPWLLLAAFCVMLLEWFVYNRKVQL